MNIQSRVTISRTAPERGFISPSVRPPLQRTVVPPHATPQRTPFYEVIKERLADTVDDIELHYKRYLKPAKKDGEEPEKPVPVGGKQKLVVLGSGWGAHSCIKIIDTDRFDVTVVSPRNFYFFTPMLPSTAVGTVEIRSLVDPIRVANPYINYVEARATKIDPEKKKLTCQLTVPLAQDSGKTQFDIEYDVLLVSVGEIPADFGVPGVRDHCCFMKETEDAIRVRRRIGECFELAASPTTTVEEKKKLLNFVVVGGGPTGVEFSGSLADFITKDLKPRYAALAPYVRITLLQSGQSILTSFQAKLQKRAIDNLSRSGCDVKLGVRVVRVHKDEVELGSGDRIPYGMCLWSAGNAPSPFTLELMNSIPAQQQFAKGTETMRGLTKIVVDPWQRVVGTKDMLAVGDACTQLEGERLPPTAQVASQQAAYTARLMNRGFTLGAGGSDAPSRKGLLGNTEEAKPFSFLSLGTMAYIGSDKALVEVDAGAVDFGISGRLALLLWSSVYITKQVSFRNRVLILFDWMKTRVFGRDLSQL